MAHRAAKLLTGFFIVALAVALAALVYALRQPGFVPPPLPQPNGYVELVQASRLLADDTYDFPTLPEEDLRELVRTNAEALKMARTALTHECQATLDYTPTNAVVLPELAGFKRLAQALAAEGKLAELENRPGDAAEAYLTTIRLGQAVSRGGLLIHSLVGIAIESIGATGLEKVVSRLSPEQRRQAAAAVEKCLARQESAAAVLAREKAWARRVFGLKGQIARLLTYNSLRQSEQRGSAKIAALQVRLQTLVKTLGAESAASEQGKPPATPPPASPAAPAGATPPTQ